ncbi:MAG TPA: glycosyltransferase family A protein [Bryobacteraceae bacterium]|nr:glycosyltransferase family A protein [Bryobacteraceae bacterium]
MSRPDLHGDPEGLITVVSPAHNASHFYAPWLQSIAAQEYANLEVILVDDGSDDGLPAQLQDAPAFVRYLRQDRGGPGAARNLAIRASHGAYLAFLDLDDRWAKGHLKRLHAALQDDPSAGIAQGLIRKFLCEPGGELAYCSEAYRFVNLGASLFRRAVFEQCGLFDEELRFGEDFDLIIRCWEQGIRKIDVAAVSLLYYRHEGNMTNGKSLIDLGAVQVYKRRLDRMRSGQVDLAVVQARGIGFPDYIGRTAGPFDEGSREPLES